VWTIALPGPHVERLHVAWRIAGAQPVADAIADDDERACMMGGEVLV
jgi:hypothetical protein